jgi:epoxyqueuosine reductase
MLQKVDYNILKTLIKDKAQELGFLELTVSSCIIDSAAQQKFQDWLAQGYAGDMQYLENNQNLRFNPQELHPSSIRLISVKVPYLTQTTTLLKNHLMQPEQAYISSYALGRDYHKVVKQQLNKLATWINQYLSETGFEHHYRAFSDSAPIMEVQIAAQSGGGWRGKNTLLLNKKHGSMFFLGELFTNLPLEVDEPTTAHCGSCNKCIEVCPTQAFISPYVLNAKKCISYLTIENKGSIPLELRSLIGNRIYGCDDCQLFCPWNKFSTLTTYTDFIPRHKLDSSSLLELFKWSEAEFTQKMQGSAILRIGYDSWQRNLAVALGNAPYEAEIITELEFKALTASIMVKEHIIWAINQQQNKHGTSTS